MERFALSRVAFFRSGLTKECLNADGNEPVESEKLTILVIVGRRTERHCLSSQVGMGSRSHCLFGESMMSLRISSSEAGEKAEKAGAVEGGGG